MAEKSRDISFDLGGILFVIFLILKLTNVIDWSWWWVTAPLWIPWAITGLFIGLYIIIILIAVLISMFD